MLTFQHRLRNQCSEDSCVCVFFFCCFFLGGGGGGGGRSIWSTVRDLGTYRTLTKIYLHYCICLGGVDVGRGMEFPFHVLYLTCFVEVGLLLFLT